MFLENSASPYQRSCVSIGQGGAVSMTYKAANVKGPAPGFKSTGLLSISSF